MENKNKFTSKGDIIGGIVLYGIFALVGIGFLCYFFSLDELKFKEIIEHYINGASGANLKNGAIVNLIYTIGGKTGCIIFLILSIFLLSYITLKEIFKLRRFLCKERLFKQGLVADMDDDHVSRSLFVILKGLFSRKSFFRKPKIYSRKELRRMQQEIEESENNATRSRRNRKL